MGILVSKSDFVGKYKLTQSISDDIDSIITQYERPLLVNLLGLELFELFESDLVSKVPTTDIYLEIYNSFFKKINGSIVASNGMKDMVLSNLFFEYVRWNRIKTVSNGQVMNSTEVSSQASSSNLFTYENDSVRNYTAIQYYIYSNKDIYPTFMGIAKYYSSLI